MKRLPAAFITLTIGLFLLGCARPVSLLPEHQSFLDSNKWVIVRSNDTSHYELGSCNYLLKTITLYTDKPSTFYHEVGHAIARSNWYGSYFRWLYECENVESINTEEFFAWAFSKYYTNPHILRLRCPNTYHMLKEGFFSDGGKVNHEFLKSYSTGR